MQPVTVTCNRTRRLIPKGLRADNEPTTSKQCMCSVQGCSHATGWPQPKSHDAPSPPKPSFDERCAAEKSIGLRCKEFLRKVNTAAALAVPLH